MTIKSRYLAAHHHVGDLIDLDGHGFTWRRWRIVAISGDIVTLERAPREVERD